MCLLDSLHFSTIYAPTVAGNCGSGAIDWNIRGELAVDVVVVFVGHPFTKKGRARVRLNSIVKSIVG